MFKHIMAPRFFKFTIFFYFHLQMQKPLIPVINFLFGLFIVAFTCGNAQANTPVIHKTPKPAWISACKPYDKRPSERNIRNGAYGELVEEQINVEEKAVYNHVITAIVSESGVQSNSEVSVSFDPSFERLDFHELTVWRNNKPQNRLILTAFKMLPEENELDKFIYNGTYSAKYILPDIRKGDRIEYSYTITGRNPIFDKFTRSIYFQGSDLIVHQYTTLLFAAGRSINIKPYNLLSQPKVSVSGGLKRYEWEDFQVPGISTNKFQPKWVNQYAHAQVSEYNNWEQIIDWGLKINPIQTSFAGELADSLTNLKKQYGKDKEKYFRAAVMLVQDEVRYMGIETGPYSHKANRPDKVFKQRYGDCKDKSLLLASILNAGGIEAHMALLNTDLLDKIDGFIPSPSIFDHAVVVATVNNKQVWVDATMSNQRGKGTDLYFPPYLKGLVLKAGGDNLTDIKQSKTGKASIVEKYDIKDEFAPVKFIVTSTYSLDRADDVRDEIATTGIAQLEKSYLEYYSKTYNKIEAADSIIIKDDQSKNELTTIESYKITNFFKRDSVKGKYTADFYADDISRQLPDVNGQVKTPVSVTYPYNMDYTIKVNLHNGWDIENEHNEITRNAYKFISDKTVSGNELALRYQFTYFKNYIPLNELTAFKKDVKDLKGDKLSYSFYYIPDIKKVPFRLNHLMLIITLIITCAFAYAGLKIFKKETTNRQYFISTGPALGGWLIWLMIVLILTSLGIIKNLLDDGFYTLSKWDLITTGIAGKMHKAFLVFDVTGYISMICFSTFCVVLMFKKRDITPHYIKMYYAFVIAFLFLDYFFNAVVQNDFSNYRVEQIIKAIVVAVVWTYYLNVSTRVKQTFVVPYKAGEVV
jgi:transglutaminase-like putative cysteine protease